MYQHRRNKFGAKRTRYKGDVYHSKAEARYAQGLELRRLGKDIAGWERQVKIPLIVNDKLIANYVIDFIITHNDRSLEYVEVKGRETDLWRLKWKLFNVLYPEVRATVVFV